MEHTQLEVANVPIKKSRNKKLNIPKNFIPPVVVFVLFLSFWQFGAQIVQIPNYILPKPTDIFHAAVSNWENLSTAVITTITEAVVGFVFSVIGGVLGAIIMASSKLLEKSLYPYAILLQTIPIVAIAPIIVIWFGSGMNAIVIIAFTIH
jgi:NitT/TauT family transport system permease protein